MLHREAWVELREQLEKAEDELLLIINNEKTPASEKERVARKLKGCILRRII
jgi:hypothetical protein